MNSSLGKPNIKKDAFQKDSLRTDFNKQLQQELQKIRGAITIINNTPPPPELDVQDFELISTWKLNENSYQEFVLTGSNITQINYWADNTKIVKLFTKDITYTGDKPTNIIITDETTGKILTTVINYSGENIINITKTISNTV